MRREIKTQGRIWLNPFSWITGERWHSIGEPLPFTVKFLRGDGVQIANSVLKPVKYAVSGFVKLTIMYASVGSGPNDLGNDARNVSNVIMEYEFEGDEFTLSHR